MPFNFLELSPTYRKKVIDTQIRRRRTIVAEEADDSFFLRRRLERVHARLKEEGLPDASDHSIKLDGMLFRTAYEFLRAEGEEKEHIRARVTNRRGRHDSGIRHLIADGIETWERILELAAEVKPEDESLPEIDDFILQAAENLASSAQTFFLALDQLRNDRQTLVQRAKVLEKEIEILKTKLARAMDTLAHVREQAAQSEQYAHVLKKELETVRHAKLQELVSQEAATSSAGRRLYKLVQEMQKKSAVKDRDSIRERLPGAMGDGRSLAYENRFLGDMLQLQQREQERIITALERFTKHGERYASLKTKKWPGQPVSGVPEGSFESRASDELRFMWKPDPEGSIRVYRAGSHADFGSSER
jgi:hypothetical protein